MKRVLLLLMSFIVMSGFYSCSDDDNGKPETPPEIQDLSTTEISSASVKLSTKILDDGGTPIVEKGFCWSDKNVLPGLSENSVEVTSEGNSIDGEITGLTANTLYYVRAYAINNSGVAFSLPVRFTTTDDGEIVVNTIDVSEITFESAVAVSSYINTSTQEITSFGFFYSSSNKLPGKDDFSVAATEAEEKITALLTGLDSDTEYYIRSYITTAIDTIYGETVAFRTEINEEELLAAFVAPGYRDDYSYIAGWGLRSSWNLANVHDPSIEKCGDYYYMYSTDASYGNTHNGHGHYLCRRSKDLVNWEFQGMAMAQTPAWVKDSLNNMRSRLGLAAIDNPSYGHWAPVVRKAGNKYRMYYSIIVDNYIQSGKQNTPANFDNSWTERAFIGLMETDDLATNQWRDKGMVVCSSTDKGKNWYRPSQNDWAGYFKWNAIDPTFIVTPQGEHWLIYGSWHSGIVALKLNPDTGKPDDLGDPWDGNALANYGKLIYTRASGNRWQASEAPEIIYNEDTGYYYLFLSYDELSVAYNTRVCRSRSITGPYTGYKGNTVTNGGEVFPVITHPYKFNNHSGWVGIAHNCVFKDDDGKWYYSSQGRLPHNTNGNSYSNAIMMGHVRKIRWTDDGWPVVMPERYAAVPDVKIKESELIGKWENITLTYQFQQQKTSQALTLTADKKATGALSGTWSYDSEKKMLTVGNQKLYVEREVDWEASPRKHTIVYAGLNSSGVSLWGKKTE